MFELIYYMFGFILDRGIKGGGGGGGGGGGKGGGGGLKGGGGGGGKCKMMMMAMLMLAKMKIIGKILFFAFGGNVNHYFDAL